MLNEYCMWKLIKTTHLVLGFYYYLLNKKHKFLKGLTPDLVKMLVECKFSQEDLEKNKGKILEALIFCKEGIRFETFPPEKTVFYLKYLFEFN